MRATAGSTRMPVRCAEPDRGWPTRARAWLLAACALCLVACTGPGLEPPSSESTVLPPDLSGPAAGGADRADAGDVVVTPPVTGNDDDPMEQVPTPGDAGQASDTDAGDDPDLDAGTP